MAIRVKRISGANGINYTHELDGPSDWAGIANDTYFKDLSDGLIYWKDLTGANVIHIYTLGGSGSGEPNAISTTYVDLITNIGNNALVPGTWYQFEYSTKHLIGGTTAEYNDTSVHYDDGTAVKSTLVPEVEILSVLALSGSVIHVEAKSHQYPNDRIYYDVYDNMTEDNIQNRPGFITYREDTTLSISAHYDWRNVLHRRFDMDNTASGRAADFKTMVGFVTSTPGYNEVPNHALKWGNTGSGNDGSGGDMIPAFANFDDGAGRSDIGAMNTFNEGTYRDFKTFVGLDNGIYASGTTGRYLNIHIENSDSQARILGSGIGVGAAFSTIPVTTTSNLYGNIGNVVFFTKSAENVNIGRNASGIMFTGYVIKDIIIGDNNENIIIGGSNSAPIYNGTTASTLDYVENLTIGNNNRNVSISTSNRRTTIGNNNTGVVYQAEMTDNTLGSYNTLVYNFYSNNTNLGDWMTTIRLTSSSNTTIKSESQTVDLIQCSVAAGWGIHKFYDLTNATIPDGFNLSTTHGNLGGTSSIYIGDRATNIFASNTSPLHIGSQVRDIEVRSAGGAKIGDLSQRIQIMNSWYVSIGDNVRDAEIQIAHNTDIDDYCTGMKIWGSDNPMRLKIGKQSATIGIYGGATGDIELGSACSNIFLSGTNTKIKVGDNNSNITARASSNVTIGHGNDEIFLEGSNNSAIGNYNTNISLADVGMIYKPGFPSFTTYSWVIDLDEMGRNYSNYQYLTGSTAPFHTGPGADWTDSLGTWALPGVLYNFRGCTNTTIGNNCDEIFIVKSDNTIIRDNSSNINIGCQADSGSVYTLGNTSGYMNPMVLSGVSPSDTAVTATTVTYGKYCHDTVIGANCDNINIRGIGQSGNTFFDNVTGVEAVSGFTFRNNRVLVDGVGVATTTSYENKIYNKSTETGGRYEESLVNLTTTGVTLTIGDLYEIKNIVTSTSGAVVSGKTYTIVDIATGSTGPTVSGQSYTIIDIATQFSATTDFVSGQTYTIETYETGDDFTNIGAASNANGVTFEATGLTATVTATTWSNGSVVSTDDFTNIGAPANTSGVIFTATGTTPTNWSNGSILTTDDFTNVGAASNNDGIIFTATGTTPTDWSNGSILVVDDFTNVGAASNTNGVIFIATGTTPTDWSNKSVLTDFDSFSAATITRLK